MTATQSDVAVRFGEPVGSGSRVAVEFWTNMKADGADATIAGLMLLRFDAAGLCEDLRECWFFEMGSHEPPAGWGT